MDNIKAAFKRGDSFQMLEQSNEELIFSLCYGIEAIRSENPNTRFAFVTSSKARKRLAADLVIKLREYGSVEEVRPIFREVWLQGACAGVAGSKEPCIKFFSYHDYYGSLDKDTRVFIDCNSVPAEEVEKAVIQAKGAVTLFAINKPMTANYGINKVFV